MIAKYPNKTNDFTFLIILSGIYTLFCIDPELPKYNIILFNNDLSEPNNAAWLFSQLLSETFIFVLAKESCARLNDRLIKAIFYAVAVDSMFTGLSALLFGYSASLSIVGIRVLFTILSMFYAYLILHEK